MTVPTETCFTELAWTGVETSFAPGFRALDTAHVTVTYLDGDDFVSTLTDGVHLILARAADGTITAEPLDMPDAPGTVRFRRVTPATQGTSFVNLEAFDAAVHERLHDAAAMRSAENRYDIDAAGETDPTEEAIEAALQAGNAATAAEAAQDAAEAAAAAAAESAALNPLATRPLFLFWGESGAGGYGLTSDASAGEKAARPEVQIYDPGSEDFANLKIGSPGQNNMYTASGLPTDGTRHGWELELGNQAADGDYDNEVYLVKAGYGAQKIVNILSGRLHHFTAWYVRAAIAAVRALGFQPQPIVCWSQGVNDSDGSAAAEDWADTALIAITEIRRLLGMCPILMSKLPPTYTAFNVVIDELCISQPWCFAVYTEDLDLLDSQHLSYAGLKGYMQRAQEIILDERYIGLGPLYDVNRDRAAAIGGVVDGAAIPPSSITYPFSGSLTDVTWTDLTNTTDEGSGELKCADDTQPVGARAVGFLNAQAPWEVHITLTDDTSSAGVVVGVNDRAVAGAYAWGDATTSPPFLFGVYQASGTLFSTADPGASGTNLGAIAAFPAEIRMRSTAAGAITVELSTNGGGSWTLKQTAADLLRERRALAVEARFALAAVDQTVSVSVGF